MNKIPLEVGKGYFVYLPKEASVKVKRYEYYTPPVWDMDSTLREKDDGDWVWADDYDALLALARRLRRALPDECDDEDDFIRTDGCDCNKCAVIRESAWLEE